MIHDELHHAGRHDLGTRLEKNGITECDYKISISRNTFITS